jgi:DNA-binding response OmpR family regulator
MKRIIIVDDDPATQDAYKMIFDPHEYEVIIYANGNALMDEQTPIPDLYLLDKQLSGVDGFDICRFLKSREQTRHVPVIMLSASPNIKQLAEIAGADDTLEKPFSINDLRALVEQYATSCE